MSTPEGQEMVSSAPGTQAFKQDFSKWETLHKEIALGLERLEAALSQRVVERRHANGCARARRPRARRISLHGGPLLPRAGAGAALHVQIATALPPWALALVAAAVVALALIAYRSRQRPVDRSASAAGRAARRALALVVLCLLRPMVPCRRPIGRRRRRRARRPARAAWACGMPTACHASSARRRF